MRFYLGTHKPIWLARLDVPLFLSRRWLAERATLPRARVGWALDSGGFTELSTRGSWSITPAQYVAEVERFRDEIGRLEWCAPMDYMCEPSIVAKTGLTIGEHQRRTLANFLELRATLGELVVPVVQGWALRDYLAHVEAYADAGVDLADERLVAVGSVCRRGQDDEIATILVELAELGLDLHAFGVRSEALRRCSDVLASADSMAWSAAARKDWPLAGCPHKSCSNCPRYALRWRARQLGGALDQARLFDREGLPL